MALIGLAAAAVYAFESIAWPLEGGRDDLNYWLYFHDLWSDRPSFMTLLAYRTPLPSLVLGPLLMWGGALLTEIALGLMYVGAVVAVHRIGAFWGRAVGIGAAVALLAYLPFGALFHTAASDAPFAFAIVVWVAYLLSCVERPTLTRFAIAGVGFALVVLVRPVGQPFVLFAVFALLVEGLSLRARLARAGVMVASAAVVLAAWATYNHVRFDDFTVSRGTAAIAPFYRLWTDNLIRPDNGPASAELAAAVREDLLDEEPYRSFGVDVDRFFGSASGRAWEDLVTLSDRRWGWGDDYGVLARASREAIRARPGAYAKSVLITLRTYLTTPYLPYFPTEPNPHETRPALPPLFIPPGAERPLPRPPDDIIPGARYSWLMSSPDGRVDVDWSSGRPILVFDDPATKARHDVVVERAAEMRRKLPGRRYWRPLTAALGQLVTLYPTTLAWLVVGVAGIALRRPPRSRFLVALVAVAVAYLVAVALGETTIVAYRLPIDPLFIVFGVAGFLAGDPRYSGRDGKQQPDRG